MFAGLQRHAVFGIGSHDFPFDQSYRSVPVISIDIEFGTDCSDSHIGCMDIERMRRIGMDIEISLAVEIDIAAVAAHILRIYQSTVRIQPYDGAIGKRCFARASIIGRESYFLMYGIAGPVEEIYGDGEQRQDRHCRNPRPKHKQLPHHAESSRHDSGSYQQLPFSLFNIAVSDLE